MEETVRELQGKELHYGAVCSCCGRTVTEEEYECGESLCCDDYVTSEEEYCEAAQEADFRDEY